MKAAHNKLPGLKFLNKFKFKRHDLQFYNQFLSFILLIFDLILFLKSFVCKTIPILLAFNPVNCLIYLRYFDLFIARLYLGIFIIKEEDCLYAAAYSVAMFLFNSFTRSNCVLNFQRNQLNYF